jgi:hypothetical protein
MSRKVKIVLDADVIIHFIKGNSLPLLHKIFPCYQCVILDIVLNQELRKNALTQRYLDNYLHYFNNIQIEKWEPGFDMTYDFALLCKKYGLGESASMVYCKYNQDIIASSNITDITLYCEENSIQYVTTMDFLWQAYINKIMTEQECDEFIVNVKTNGSKLPCNRISEYEPRELLL